MPLPVSDWIDRIDEEASLWAGREDAWSRTRHGSLVYLLGLLRSEGFPADSDQRRELSLIPLVFQEANYDDIEWTDRTAPHGHLAGILAVDLAIQTAGRSRDGLTDAEYDEYVRVGLAAIDRRKRRR